MTEQIAIEGIARNAPQGALRSDMYRACRAVPAERLGPPVQHACALRMYTSTNADPHHHRRSRRTVFARPWATALSEHGDRDHHERRGHARLLLAGFSPSALN